MEPQPPSATTSPAARRPLVRDDIAYILPMGILLALLMVGNTWPSLYPASYVARTVLAGIALIVLWRHFTPIRWNYWWLGVIVGVIGVLQWVPMQLGLQAWLPQFFSPDENAFNPRTYFESPAAMWSWIAIRMIGAVIVVPIMEELFWRDFAWRTVLAPNDFKLAEVGEWHWQPFVIVPIIFAFVHGNWWLTAIVWGFLIAALLVYTKSLGACIIAHAVTNLLLGVYVLWRGFCTDQPQWWFW